MKYLILLFLVACGEGIVTPPEPQKYCNVVFSWDVPSEEQQKIIIGYRLYYGETTRDYADITETDGVAYELSVRDYFECGKTYYSAVTAFSETEESEFSDEITWMFTAEQMPDGEAQRVVLP